MVTIILAAALLVALIGLGLEIGIASWNIRRSKRYRHRELAACHISELAVSGRQDMAARMKSLDDYAGKISWLLNFLYNRYDKFADLEKEVNEGLKGVTDGPAIGEADAKYTELKKALKIVKVTVRVSERMENLMNSISAQLIQIADDFRDEDEESESGSSGKPDAGEAAGSEPPKAEAPESSEADPV